MNVMSLRVLGRSQKFNAHINNFFQLSTNAMVSQLNIKYAAFRNSRNPKSAFNLNKYTGKW